MRRLFRPGEYRKVDYNLIPTAVFSLPNIGTVGLTTAQALEAGHRVKHHESRFRPMKPTLTGDQQQTRLQLVIAADTDPPLGCTMGWPAAAAVMQGTGQSAQRGA